ncbi:hypothetical protein M406DRAFT_245308 [Cryphonectria parasitica EP155]|uniref:Zn(2)-C6 fungal-type domain-containing protein n=1 Tax=Cryphonectria parasitica (strain ATCC 38755 / EP155) TaxID=660469 RepID=A0A9P4YE36_CRYP1|nr:uncharacterized protein M406DRAFT_245308 [Cryphonectria parasitica EP155]KAF3771278.1 hypothetical protein M406DRAFT_245308 [Cryphonectria parasitica EP155]
MRVSPGSSGPSTSNTDTVPTTKRSRVLLSCAPCRMSKLKCDRGVPCSQCLKKARPSACVYAPKPVRNRPPKSMSARLKRLEGMVRGMIDEEGNITTSAPTTTTKVSPQQSSRSAAVAGPPEKEGNGAARGGSMAYVGATHFMAMLDDIEDLKSYFDDDDDWPVEDDSADPTPEADSPELLMVNTVAPRSKQDLLALLPPRGIADRLSRTDIVHKPTFVKRYTEFANNTASSAIDMDWLALLFMVFSLGIFFSSFSAPHELALDDTPLTPTQRFRQYRNAAGWALTTSSRSDGRYSYSSPATSTCAPFLLYVESEFLINRVSHMNCYLLSGVCIRIMLKMGLHRDPSKLPGAQLSAYDAEMRRRLWNLAIQIDLMVSFHLGLPSMIHGIESDTLPPHNLLDEDFDEDTVEMPPERTSTDYTHMTYPIYKSSICKVFGEVARQAHSLTVPTYAEVMEIDGLLEERWAAIPSFMKVRPLDTCITDSPFQVIQRFGLGGLYQKARCVLHRRYLVEKDPKPEHDYSRRVCVLGALALLEYQNTLFEATKPGRLLAQNGWFVSSLAMHDFLLGAMIVYLILQNETYNEPGGEYDLRDKHTPLPNRQQLLELLKRSHSIWKEVALENPELKKAPEVLETMFRKLAQSPRAQRGTLSPADGRREPTTRPWTRTGFAVANSGTSGQLCPPPPPKKKDRSHAGNRLSLLQS